MANFVTPNQIQIQIGLVLLVRPDTRDNMSQPCKQEKEEKTDKDDDEGPKVPAMFEFEPVCRTVEAVISLRSEMPGISKKLYEVSNTLLTG